MIQLRSLAFGPFAEAEPLNPNFLPGHSKLRLTVDASNGAQRTDARTLERLVAAFPGLKRHRCQMDARAGAIESGARGIVLLPEEPSANQAHLLEHLALEMLSALEQASRRSGVTCAYTSPVERSDVFVECRAREAGSVAVLLSIGALNAALAGHAVVPLFPDALRAAQVWVESPTSGGWNASRLGGAARLAPERAAAVLDYFCRTGLAAPEPYALNFSGDAAYRFVRRGAIKSAGPDPGPAP